MKKLSWQEADSQKSRQNVQVQGWKETSCVQINKAYGNDGSLQI